MPIFRPGTFGQSRAYLRMRILNLIVAAALVTGVTAFVGTARAESPAGEQVAAAIEPGPAEAEPRRDDAAQSEPTDEPQPPPTGRPARSPQAEALARALMFISQANGGRPFPLMPR